MVWEHGKNNMGHGGMIIHRVRIEILHALYIHIAYVQISSEVILILNLRVSDITFNPRHSDGSTQHR